MQLPCLKQGFFTSIQNAISYRFGRKVTVDRETAGKLVNTLEKSKKNDGQEIKQALAEYKIAATEGVQLISCRRKESTDLPFSSSPGQLSDHPESISYKETAKPKTALEDYPGDNISVHSNHSIDSALPDDQISIASTDSDAISIGSTESGFHELNRDSSLVPGPQNTFTPQKRSVSFNKETTTYNPSADHSIESNLKEIEQKFDTFLTTHKKKRIDRLYQEIERYITDLPTAQDVLHFAKMIQHSEAYTDHQKEVIQEIALLHCLPATPPTRNTPENDAGEIIAIQVDRMLRQDNAKELMQTYISQIQTQDHLDMLEYILNDDQYAAPEDPNDQDIALKDTDDSEELDPEELYSWLEELRPEIDDRRKSIGQKYSTRL